MATLVLCIVVLFVSYRQPGLAIPLVATLAGFVAFGIIAIALLDVLQRRDLDRKQRLRWLLLLGLGLPPFGAVTYLALGRTRTATLLRAEPLPPPERRPPPRQYKIRDPFHRG